MTIGHRICIMNAGEVVQTGAPLEVYRSPANAFVARFLGSPPMNLLPATLEPAGDHAKLHLAGAIFDLPDWPLAALRNHLNRAVTLGIRPEDLYESPAAPMPRLRVQVRGIEPLGAETILVLAAGVGNHELLARVGRETALRIGETTDIAIDVSAIHLFDGETGDAVSRQAA
jgi:ABC-type sugar transport system ATPase subunit